MDDFQDQIVNSPEGRLHLHFAYQVSNNLKKKQSVSVSENQNPGFYYCPKPQPIGGYHCYKSSRDYNQNSPIGY
jgi:hypothetical protein